MVQLTDKGHWAVEVPESWESAELHFQPSIEDMLNDREGFSELIMWYTSNKCGSPRQKLAIKLPVTGSWQFLFTTKEATEEDAKKVVGVFAVNIASTYRNYMWPQGSDFFWRSIDSLQSLLSVKGCNLRKNYAIILNHHQ